MKKTPFKDECHYDYANKCDCSEDDKCGCTYPNNMSHGYSEDCFEINYKKAKGEDIHFINFQQEDDELLTTDDSWKKIPQTPNQPTQNNYNFEN